MKIHGFIILLFSLFLVSCVNYLKKGEESYALGEYTDAAKYFHRGYLKISPKDRSKRGEIAYKTGDCYSLVNAATRASSYFQNAIRYHYPDSIVYLRLAQEELRTGNYHDAAIHFREYLEHHSTNQLAKNGFTSTQLAPQLKEEPTVYKVSLMKLFQSRRSEYSPMYVGDDPDILYFTSTRDQSKGTTLNGITGMKSADIFEAKRNEKKQWQRPEVITSDINTEYEDGACSFTADGKTMYFTRCRQSPSSPVYAEIWQSQRAGAAWGSPSKSAIINDTLSSVAHPAVSPNGQYLYFTSDMPGGYGGKDIWRVPILGANFGAVENLGPTINTAGDEMFPTMRNDSTLYFSSNGHPGMGGLDIYCATQDSSAWHIINMGPPINSSYDDFGITFEPGAVEQGFFSSNRNDARGWDHIYSFLDDQPTHLLTGWVYDKEGDALPAAMVSLIGQDGTNKRINVNGEGSFTIALRPGTTYLLLAGCVGYINNQEQLTTDTIRADKKYELDFPLASITRPVLIDNIFYDFNKASLTNASEKSLNELIKMLKDNPHITIELSAHCDYRGTDEYNTNLSQRRAESVERYLIHGGIANDRLTAKGYGKSKPKVINKRMVKTYPYLKAGDVLTADFIQKLPPNQQEVCNELNRRTEFQVIRTTYGMYK
jgi:peptidoglycan-associated lipoprotein